MEDKLEVKPTVSKVDSATESHYGKTPELQNGQRYQLMNEGKGDSLEYANIPS